MININNCSVFLLLTKKQIENVMNSDLDNILYYFNNFYLDALLIKHFNYIFATVFTLN